MAAFSWLVPPLPLGCHGDGQDGVTEGSFSLFPRSERSYSGREPSAQRHAEEMRHAGEGMREVQKRFSRVRRLKQEPCWLRPLHRDLLTCAVITSPACRCCEVPLGSITGSFI